MPRVGIFYALKVNPDEEIAKRCLKLGLGFDCASAQEIDQVLKMGT